MSQPDHSVVHEYGYLTVSWHPREQALIIAVAATTFAPLLNRRTLLYGSAIACAAAIISAALTMVFPVYTNDHPRRQAIEHELATSTVNVSSKRDGDVVTLRVVSSRNADRLMLDFEKEIDVLRVNGVAPAPPNRGRVSRGAVVIYAREATVELRVPVERALTLYLQAYNTDPHNAFAQNGVAESLLLLKRYPEAQNAYRAILQARPSDAKALRGAGDAFAFAGKPEAALPYYQKAVQLAPDDLSVR